MVLKGADPDTAFFLRQRWFAVHVDPIGPSEPMETEADELMYTEAGAVMMTEGT
jgi:hypothetical protein